MTTADPAAIRRRGFTVVTIGFAAFLYLFSPLNLLVIGWFADFEDAISHRVHEVVFGAMFAMVFVGIVAQARHPERHIGSFLQSAAVLTAFAVVVSASTGFEAPVLAYVLPPLLMLIAHPNPAAVLRPAVRFHAGIALLLAAAMLPMGLATVDHFGKALDRVQGHESHWGAVAAFAVAVLLSAVIVSFRPAGWKVVARTTAGAVTAYAVVSLAFRFDASALDPVAAVVSLIWSGALVTASFVVDRPVSTRFGTRRLGTRRPSEGIVAGVAAGFSHRTGIPVRRIRIGIAMTLLLGAMAYVVLWVLMPVEPGTQRDRPVFRPSVWNVLAGTVVLGLVVGSAADLLLLAVLVAGVALAVVVGRRSRRRPKAAGGAIAHRVVRGLFGVQVGFLGLALVMMWSFGFGTPVVPHKIVQTTTTYCATCHVQGLAKGAPIIDRLNHGYGSPLVTGCVSCHDHLPPAAEPTVGAGALWPSLRPVPDAVLSATDLALVAARLPEQAP